MDIRLQSTIAPNIFRRLPSGVFSALSSELRELMWELLVELFGTFFGPDAARGGEEQYLRRDVVVEIERFLTATDGKRPWNSGEGLAAESTVSIRANQHIDRLVDTGWLIQESEGVRKIISMTPTMQKFLELLIQYAEEGPRLVGGKIQNIYNNLVAIEQSPGEQAWSLHETAAQARALITSISGTSLRVKEVMERLNEQESVAKLVSTFFKDYVSNFFIRDYHELSTENHPLRRQHDILRITFSLRDDTEKRDALIKGYQQALKVRTLTEAEEQFEKDIAKLLKLEDIQRFLDRLDDSIVRATRKALSQISYQLRVQGRIEQLISQTIQALTSHEVSTEGLGLGLAPGALFSEERLREPPQKQKEPEPQVIRRAAMSPEQRAMIELRRAMTKAREISRAQIKRYANAYIPTGETLSSDALPITTVNDMVVFMALSRAAFLTFSTARLDPRERRNVQLLALTKGLRLEPVLGQRTANPFVETPRFLVTREGDL